MSNNEKQQARWWIPEPVRPEDIIYRLCYRCGVDVQPQAGRPRKCRDCYDLENCAQRDAARDRVIELMAAGASSAVMAAEFGVSRTTAQKWCRAIKEEEAGVLV